MPRKKLRIPVRLTLEGELAEIVARIALHRKVKKYGIVVKSLLEEGIAHYCKYHREECYEPVEVVVVDEQPQDDEATEATQ